MTEPDLRLRAVIPASPKVVYEALTDPAALRVWLAEHADVDLPGKYEFWGRFTPDGAKPHQRVLHVDERTIRFGWTVDGVESTVQFELAEDEGGTLVTLSQSDLPSFAEVLADGLSKAMRQRVIAETRSRTPLSANKFEIYSAVPSPSSVGFVAMMISWTPPWWTRSSRPAMVRSSGPTSSKGASRPCST